MTSKIGSFDLHQLRTTDVTKAGQFYQAVFGWEAKKEGSALCLSFAGLPVASVVEASKEMHGWLCGIAVESLDASLAKIGDAGGATVAKETSFTVATDPQRGVFLVHQAAGAADKDNKQSQQAATATSSAVSSELKLGGVVGALSSSTQTEEELPEVFCWHQLVSAAPAESLKFWKATFGWRETSLRGKVVALRTVDSFAPHASVLDMNAPAPAARSKGKAGSGSAVESKGGSSAAAATGSDAKMAAGGKDSDKKDKATGAYWVPFVQVDSVDATIGKVLKNGGSVMSAASSIPSVGRFAVVSDGLGASIGVLAPHEEAAEDADFEEFAPAEVVGDWEHFDEKEFDRIAAQNAAASAGGALPGMGGGRAAGSGGSGSGSGGGGGASSASSGYSSGGGSHSFGLGL